MKKYLSIVCLLGLFSCEGTFLNPKKCYVCTEITTISANATGVRATQTDRKYEVCGQKELASERIKKSESSTTQAGITFTTRTQVQGCVAK